MNRKLVVAVSGGVDSVVLLDMICRRGDDLVVVHVDHGIRGESDEDAAFVTELCRLRGVPCIVKRLELGAGASEDTARQARYDVLFAIAEQSGGVIVTAHHRDDMVGSVAINLIRGTSWRGLAVMNRSGVIRPLLAYTKAQLYSYAIQHRLEWVEDATNRSPDYLRNRLRAKVLALPETSSQQVLRLRQRQCDLSQDITDELERASDCARQSRYFFTNIDATVAVELLGYQLQQQTGERFLYDTLARALLAIKTGKNDTLHDVGAGVRLRLRRYSFVVETEN